MEGLSGQGVQVPIGVCWPKKKEKAFQATGQHGKGVSPNGKGCALPCLLALCSSNSGPHPHPPQSSLLLGKARRWCWW